MSSQIEDLIANIEQKFDDEFKEINQHNSASKADTNIKDNHQDNINPQLEKINKQNPIAHKLNDKKQQQIVIEDDQEHEQANHQSQSNIEQPSKEDQQHHREDHEEYQQCQEGDQQGENKYRELSNKLQTALKKISSSKNGFQTFNGTQSAALFERFNDYQKKKQRDLEQKRKLEQEKKYHGLKSKPDINAKSKLIAQETSYRPIYERFDKILEDKKKKMELNQQHKKMKEQQQFQQFISQFKKHAKVQPDECRDTNTYFNDMIAWKAKLEKSRTQKLKQKQEKEKQGYTFKPQLNQKSVRMLKNQKRIPIHERQIQRPKTEQSQYSFQPKINKRRVK